jgi:hypothetical protein
VFTFVNITRVYSLIGPFKPLMQMLSLIPFCRDVSQEAANQGRLDSQWGSNSD